MLKWNEESVQQIKLSSPLSEQQHISRRQAADQKENCSHFSTLAVVESSRREGKKCNPRRIKPIKAKQKQEKVCFLDMRADVAEKEFPQTL